MASRTLEIMKLAIKDRPKREIRRGCWCVLSPSKEIGIIAEPAREFIVSEGKPAQIGAFVHITNDKGQTTEQIIAPFDTIEVLWPDDPRIAGRITARNKAA